MADDDIADLIYSQSRQARAAALGALDEDHDPDKAGEALRLGQVTGANPSLIYPDPQEYQRRVKSHIVDEFLRTNPNLQDYANSHSLAPVVSANDWPKLDALDQSLSAFARGGKSVTAVAVKGFKDHFDLNDALGVEMGEKVKDNRLLWSITTGLTQPLYALGVGLPTQTFTAGLAGLKEGLVEAQKQAGVPEGHAEYNARQLTSLVEARLMRTEGAPHSMAKQVNENLRREIQRATPFVEAGESPPAALGGLVAEARKLEDKEAAKHIDELMKSAGETETKALAPDLLKENFIKPRVEDARVGLDAKALDILYPEGKIPEEDDGILGWVPNIQEQVARARATGADIDIPLADFAAKMDPTVLREVKDHIRPRAGSRTPEEWKRPVEEPKPPEEAKAEPEAAAPPLHEVLRDVSGMSARGWEKVEGGVVVMPPERGIVPEKTIAGEPIANTDVKSTHAFPVADALKEIDSNRLVGAAKVLDEFFRERLGKLVGDVPIHLMSKEGMAELTAARGVPHMKDTPGMYMAPEHEIALREESARGEKGHNYAAHLILHEGAHALTTMSMAKYPELSALAKELMGEADAALTKVSPADRGFHDYAFRNEKEFLSEMIGNSRFRELASVIPISKELAAKLKLTKEIGNNVWDAVRRIVKDILERAMGREVPLSVLDGFLQLGKEFEAVETRRQMVGMDWREFWNEPGPPPLEIPDYLQKAFASGKALRMNNDRLRRHLELAAQQHQEDIDFSKNQETLAAGKQATKDWKDNVDRVRRESRETISAQPDIAVDRYLREGILPNESKEPKVKLHRGSVPDEYRDRIPRDYMDADRGVHPDQLATRFGYQSGREVLEHLARLDEQRTLEGLTPAAYITQRVEAETQRRMERDYGRSAEDILGDAKDHIFSPTTHDILHNELAALYEMNGQQPITKEQLKQHAKVIYDRLPHTMHSTVGYMAEMSRMREEVIDNLLEGKNVDALAAQQKIALLAYQAEFARKTEKLRGQFDRAWENKWQRREPPGMEQRDAIALHEIAMKFGLRPKRVAGDIERQKQLLDYTNLQDYVNHIADLANQTPDVMNPGQVPIASWLVPDSPHPRNKWPEFDDLTHQELEDVFTSMKAIDHYSRNEKKYRVKGELADLADVQKGLIERLKAAVGYKQISPGKKQEPSIPRMIGSVLLNPESWAFRLDLGNALGPFNQLIVRPIMEGLYEERKLEREFNELWSKLPKIEKREAVVNPGLFKDPANPAELMELDTHSLRAIIQNMGNPRQREKLARGYGIDNPDKIWDWLFNTVGITKEHFDFARQMAGIFEKAFEGTEQADIKRYGVAPQRIELGEIQTPWGMEKEWYHPLIADSTRHSTMLKAEDMIDESGFYRPAPASGFKKERTGATYPIDLTFDLVPYKLRQILKYNAMAWRVAEVSKIVLNKDFRTAFKQYYGVEYEGALIKWLKDSAGNREWDPAGDRAIAGSVKYLQDNLSSAMIGFNLGTVLKHGPTALAYSAKEAGPINFAESALKMIREWPGAQEAWQQAHEKSAEISSRWRSMKENIQGTNEELFNKLDPTRKFLTIREAIQLVGHYPVAIVDLFSAVPMWDAVYRDGIKRGLPETDAVYAADTAVRRTHGSTIIGARAGIMRTRDPYGLVKTFMPFYNFMSNALQRNWEMGWRAKLAMTGRELPEMTGFEKETYEKGFKNLKFALGGIMVYGVLTSLIEQAVDPLPAGKDEGNLSYWGRALTRAYPSQIPFARDIFNAIFHGRDPSTGLVGSFARNVVEEFKPSTWVGMDPAKIWRKTNTLIGTLTGLTNEQVGKVGTYIFNLSKGKEQSIRGPTDAYEVYRHGTLKKQPRSAEELMREIGGARR